MKLSVIVPVWNGSSVIADCLAAVFAHSGDPPPEVICVDNASRDESAMLVVARYPQVQLIRQPVNLGFAGGVNAGIETAQGEVFVLLNQDCIVQPGWWTAVQQALIDHPQFGIVGCTILNADGAVNHAGAFIRRPEAIGVHVTDVGAGQARSVEYVTGAAMAIRRATWEAVGRFDEGFYPAYYEESDYCYRARRKGFDIGYVPEARVVHLLSSREWQQDPIKHAANHHASCYRFVGKHFDVDAFSRFFESESAAASDERYFEQAVGRILATRATLRSLPDVIERRRADLDDRLPPAVRRQLQVGFTDVLRRSFSTAERLSQPQVGALPSDQTERRQTIQQRLDSLRQREHDLLTRIYFKSPSSVDPEPALRRLFRWLVLRPLSFLVGREHLLLAELNTVHVARLDWAGLHADLLERRLRLLELLTDYDHR